MVRTKIRARRVRTWGLMPLLAATLLICVLILIQLMAPNPLGCTPETLKTPAVYVEHMGGGDKPIDPIVIATRRPSDRELSCWVRRFRMFPEVFLVTEEELAEVNKLLKGSKPGGAGIAEPREFRYVLVSKLAAVESGFLDGTQSHEFYAAMATYLDGRQPELHEYLTSRIF
jgi:hypothetical protein